MFSIAKCSSSILGNSAFYTQIVLILPFKRHDLGAAADADAGNLVDNRQVAACVCGLLVCLRLVGL